MPVLTQKQLRRLSRLEGKIRRLEGDRLASLAADVDSQYSIVEVGAFKGKSASYLATGARAGRGAHVYSVDLWTLGGQKDKHGGNGVKQPYDQPETYQAYCATVEAMGVAEQVTPIVSASLNAACQWEMPIGLLFIDAEHSYRGCLSDIDAWARHLIPGGWIAVHDYSESFPGVIAAVQERIVTCAAWGEIKTHDTLLTARFVGA